MRTVLVALSLLAPTHALAFCGHYVGAAGSEIYNQTSQIAITRQGHRTTLTLANDVQTSVADFAIVIPVPQVLPEEAIAVLEPEVFEALDAYSSPRLVEYSCDDLYDKLYATDDSDGGDPSPGPAGESEGVTVEAEYAVGEYQIVILSATESGALITWLDDNGYAVAPKASDLLGEYIDAGSYFFAAKVRLQRVPDQAAVLAPLQFSYDADAFSLPIRIGTLSSHGEQDLIAYVLTDRDAGRVGIANYPEATLEDECLWVGEDWGGDFGAFYADRFGTAIDRAGGNAWVMEYSWAPYHCDPCVGEPITPEAATSLGFDGELSNAHFTRLHMRYGADVPADVMLYASGLSDQDQIRYIRWIPEIEASFPVCDLGMLAEPGTCDDPTSGLPRRCGCTTVTVPLPAMAPALFLLPLLGLRRRR